MRPGEEPIVAMEDLSFRYGASAVGNDRPYAIKGIGLELRRGEIVALIGENGSGKSTLARHLNGLLKPVSGRVLVGGEDTRRTSVARLAGRVGFAFQNPDHQLFAPTVAVEVAFGPRNLGLPTAEVERRVGATLVALGLTAVAERHPLLLGHGRRRLVALAGVLALETDLLVLDEPTVGLDRRAVERVLAVVEQRQGRGGSAVVITHDLSLVADRATRVIVLHRGEIVADGPTRRVLGDDRLLARAGLAMPPVTRLGRALSSFGVRSDALTVDELCVDVEAAWRRRRVGSAT